MCSYLYLFALRLWWAVGEHKSYVGSGRAKFVAREAEGSSRGKGGERQAEQSHSETEGIGQKGEGKETNTETGETKIALTLHDTTLYNYRVPISINFNHLKILFGNLAIYDAFFNQK